MRVEHHDGYRLVVGGPVPPLADAITLGRTIVVRTSAAGRRGLLAHELVHVRQFAEHGVLRFLALYVCSYLRWRLSGYRHMAAYRRIPLEVEASWLSRLHRVEELEPAKAGRTPARSGRRGSTTRPRPSLPRGARNRTRRPAPAR